MFNKQSKFRAPEPSQLSQKLSARPREVASPVQFLSDSDATKENLSPASINPFQKMPASKSTYQPHFTDVHSSDDEESLNINVTNPLLYSKKKRRVLLSSPSNSDTDTDPEQKQITYSSETIALAKHASFQRPSPERIGAQQSSAQENAKSERHEVEDVPIRGVPAYFKSYSSKV